MLTSIIYNVQKLKISQSNEHLCLPERNERTISNSKQSNSDKGHSLSLLREKSSNNSTAYLPKYSSEGVTENHGLLWCSDTPSHDSETDSGFDTSDECLDYISKDGSTKHRQRPYWKEFLCSDGLIQTVPNDFYPFQLCLHVDYNELDDADFDCNYDSSDEEVSWIFQNSTCHYLKKQYDYLNDVNACNRPSSPAKLSPFEKKTSNNEAIELFSPVSFCTRPPEDAVRPMLVN